MMRIPKIIILYYVEIIYKEPNIWNIENIKFRKEWREGREGVGGNNLRLMEWDFQREGIIWHNKLCK